jgi:hypothetical protein
LAVPELPIHELVENRRRSIAMLPVGAPALNRDDALELLEQLEAVLLALREGKTQDEMRWRSSVVRSADQVADRGRACCCRRR